MNKLIDLVLKNNKLKTLEDAFNEFPGELDNYGNYIINEEKQDYNFKYKVRDIVFVNDYKYQNGVLGSNHLFIIIEDNYAITLDYFCFLISSKLDKLNYNSNVLITKNNKNNLDKNSIIKTDAIYSIKNKDIAFKIGEITQEQLDLYVNKFNSLYEK